MASTIFIDNQTTIYAAWLNDVNSAVYDGIFQSPTITATSMVCTGTASGTGFTNLINNALSAPGAIGSATPNTGAFTTLSATSITATSISGLTTALTTAQGGTGLTSAGTSGNVLVSNGTNWTSAANPSIGIGQTWQDVASSRAFSTTYTNSTSKPIMVVVGASGVGSGALSILLYVTVNGVAFPPSGVESAYDVSATTGACISFIVPAGNTYSVVATRNRGSVGMSGWVELR